MEFLFKIKEQLIEIELITEEKKNDLKNKLIETEKRLKIIINAVVLAWNTDWNL